MARGCGQVLELVFKHEDYNPSSSTELIADTERIPLDCAIKRIDMQINAYTADSGGYIGVFVHTGGYGDTDVGYETGLGNFVADLQSAPTVVMGGGLIMHRTIYAKQGTQTRYNFVKEMYRKIRRGDVLALGIVNQFTATGADDIDIHVKIVLEPLCYHHRKSNFKSGLEFGFHRNFSQDARIEWVPPCDGVIVANEAYVWSQAAQEMNCIITQSMDPDATVDELEEGVMMPRSLIMQGEMVDGGCIRNFHPKFNVRAGKPVRIEIDTSGYLAWYGTFFPKHGSQLKHHIPLPSIDSNWSIVENPISMRLGQVLLQGMLNASAARQGFVNVSGFFSPVDLAMTTADVTEGQGVGFIPNTVTDASTNMLFRIPIDAANGATERIEQGIVLNKVVKEGDMFGYESDIASIADDLTLMLILNGIVWNRGKRYRIRNGAECLEPANVFHDMSLDLT